MFSVVLIACRRTCRCSQQLRDERAAYTGRRGGHLSRFPDHLPLRVRIGLFQMPPASLLTAPARGQRRRSARLDAALAGCRLHHQTMTCCAFVIAALGRGLQPPAKPPESIGMWSFWPFGRQLQFQRPLNQASGNAAAPPVSSLSAAGVCPFSVSLAFLENSLRTHRKSLTGAAE